MQTAPVFKQASIRPGNKAVPTHLVRCSAGSLRCAGWRGVRVGEEKGDKSQCQKNSRFCTEEGVQGGGRGREML